MRLLALPCLALALCACAPLPQRAGIPTQWRPSPNYGERRPNFVIVHHTGSSSAAQALATLTDYDRGVSEAREAQPSEGPKGASPTDRRAADATTHDTHAKVRRPPVSAHYLIGRDGTIWQLVDERARAWHAGDSWWGGVTDLNSISLGIELDNDGAEAFADAQIAALLALLTDIAERYAIPPANVLGHGDIAPGRKADPSRYFPWRSLAQHGFGLWCDPPADAPSAPPDRATALLLLQALGYDIAEPEAAMAAFRRHFRGADDAVLAADDIAVLQCLVALKTAR